MSEESKKSVHLDLNHDEHPGLYRYAIELLNYPELTEEEYAAVMADLKKPEEDPLYLAAQEKLICAHLGMVLSMAINTSFKYYGLSMEDFVGIGNHAIVERFSYFKPNKQARFSTYMRKVVERWVYSNLKKHITWNRNDEVNVELVGNDYDERKYLEFVRKVEDAIKTLSAEEQTIIRMLYYNDEQPGVDAVARRLGRTKQGFKRTIEEIYAKLRPLLNGIYRPQWKTFITLKDEDDENRDD